MVKVNEWCRKNIGLILGLILTLSLLWPLFKSDYFSHHDNVQVIRLFEMDKCIKDLQIPCRWVPDLGGLYGYPLFNYYAPLPYYFGEIFYLLGFSLTVSAKIMFAIPFIGSFIFMYLAARKLWGDWGGVLSGIFYSFAPYHAVVFYVRGAMGELWGLMFFPAIFWALLRLKESVKIINLLLLSLMVAGLLISHNLSAMIFLPITISLAIIFFFQEKNFKFLKLSIIAFGLGVLLSAFYWLPMNLEKNLSHVETTTFGYFSYTEHFKGLRKLILDRSWGWGASVREVPGGEKDGMSFQIGWVHLISWLLALLSAVFLWNKKRVLSEVVIFSSALAVLSIFMVNPKSGFIWQSFEPLKYLQFPWRFLMLVTFFISFISGSILIWLNGRFKILLSIVLMILVVGVNFFYFRPEKLFQTSDQQLLSGENWDSQIKRSIFDFLPIYAKAPPAELATKRYEVLSGDVLVFNWRQGSDWLSFDASSNNESSIKISQYYFPGWQIKIDGVETKIYHNNDLGLMTIYLNPGNHKVEARLYNSTARMTGNILSLGGTLIFIILGILVYKRKI